MSVAATSPPRAWLVSCARYTAVQLAKGVIFLGLVAAGLAPGLVMLGIQRAMGWRYAEAPIYTDSLQGAADDAQAALNSADAHLKAEILTDNSPEAIANIKASLQAELELLDVAVETRDRADGAAEAKKQAEELADTANDGLEQP